MQMIKEIMILENADPSEPMIEDKKLTIIKKNRAEVGIILGQSSPVTCILSD